jgi:hypothetical protein
MADVSKASRFIPSSNDPQPRTKDDDENDEERMTRRSTNDGNETLNNYKHKNLESARFSASAIPQSFFFAVRK